MIIKGDIMTQDHAMNAYFSSFEGKYIIMDNLDEKGDPIIRERKEIYNSEYVYITVVLRGTLNIIVGGNKLEIKANEFLAVMPCMSVSVLESRCIYFCFLTRTHLMTDIYKRVGVARQVVERLDAKSILNQEHQILKAESVLYKEQAGDILKPASEESKYTTTKVEVGGKVDKGDQQQSMSQIAQSASPKTHSFYHAFKFRHARFTLDKISLMLEYYKRIKKEHQTEDYPMKEIVFRSYQAAFVAKFFSFAVPENIINYVTNDRQYKLFNDFLVLLNYKHKEERSVQYYAGILCITPKYLSTVVLKYTGMTASSVIDQYVVFAIKQSLYVNDRSIKKVSLEYNFPSQSFFGRYFKRITGLSPNEYIKQNNVKSINFVNS